jgi:hypothetical protein
MIRDWYGADGAPLYVPLREQTLEQRNAEKLRRAKDWLGEKWLLHPANKITKEAKK